MKTRLALAMVTSAAACVGATPATAQGFLKRLTDRVQQQVGHKVEQQAEALLDGGVQAPASPAKRTAQAEPAAAKASGQAGTGGSFTSKIGKPAGFDATYAAYVKFAEVPCGACEGGIEPAGWPRFPADQFSGQYNERAKRIGLMPVGHVHRWQVRGAAGTLTVVSEDPVNGLRCRQLRYRVTRGDENAERPGLVCFGRQYASSSLETWHEVY